MTSQTELVHLTDPTWDGGQNGDIIEAGGPTVLPKKITLTSGSWMLTADFTATPFAQDALPDGQVFPRMTVLANGNPVFTVGGGGLEQLTTDHEVGITSYYSGTYEITVPASGTVLSFSFEGLVRTPSLGVQTDYYSLNGATLTATQLSAGWPPAMRCRELGCQRVPVLFRVCPLISCLAITLCLHPVDVQRCPR